MTSCLQMITVIGCDEYGVDEATLLPFACSLDIEIIKNEISDMSNRGIVSFAIVRGTDMTIDRFVSKHEAMRFAEIKLIKELPRGHR